MSLGEATLIRLRRRRTVRKVSWAEILFEETSSSGVPESPERRRDASFPMSIGDAETESRARNSVSQEVEEIKNTGRAFSPKLRVPISDEARKLAYGLKVSAGIESSTSRSDLELQKRVMKYHRAKSQIAVMIPDRNPDETVVQKEFVEFVIKKAKEFGMPDETIASLESYIDKMRNSKHGFLENIFITLRGKLCPVFDQTREK